MLDDEELLEAAYEAEPDSRFVLSLQSFWEKNNYITDRQREVLEGIVARHS